MSLSVLVVAESDSYLKWAVSLLGQIPGTLRSQVALAGSPIRPSAAQRSAALAGTPYAHLRPSVLSAGRLRDRVEQERPDAVVLACTGPTVHAYSEALSRSAHRPVLIAGIPGIALPARERAWSSRGAIDLLVVHSHREVADYETVRQLTGRTGAVGLATIPFLRDPAAGVPAPTPPPNARPSVVFATQGKVPLERQERIAILLALSQLADNRPDLRVVVKTRGEPGEFHTHYEQHHYLELRRQLTADGSMGNPQALTFATGSMAHHLDGAAAMVTVSSTAVLEAIARDLPVLLIDEFGVSAELINEVFVGSGCLGGLAALSAADFRRPEGRWRAENYFHPASDNTWYHLLEKLIDQAGRGELPPLAEGLDPGRNSVRRQIERLRITPVGSELVRIRQRARLRLLHDVDEGVTSVV